MPAALATPNLAAGFGKPEGRVPASATPGHWSTLAADMTPHELFSVRSLSLSGREHDLLDQLLASGGTDAPGSASPALFPAVSPMYGYGAGNNPFADAALQPELSDCSRRTTAEHHDGQAPVSLLADPQTWPSRLGGKGTVPSTAEAGSALLNTYSEPLPFSAAVPHHLPHLHLMQPPQAPPLPAADDGSSAPGAGHQGAAATEHPAPDVSDMPGGRAEWRGQHPAPMAVDCSAAGTGAGASPPHGPRRGPASQPARGAPHRLSRSMTSLDDGGLLPPAQSAPQLRAAEHGAAGPGRGPSSRAAPTSPMREEEAGSFRPSGSALGPHGPCDDGYGAACDGGEPGPGPRSSLSAPDALGKRGRPAGGAGPCAMSVDAAHARGGEGLPATSAAAPAQRSCGAPPNMGDPAGGGGYSPTSYARSHGDPMSLSGVGAGYETDPMYPYPYGAAPYGAPPYGGSYSMPPPPYYPGYPPPYYPPPPGAHMVQPRHAPPPPHPMDAHAGPRMLHYPGYMAPRQRIYRRFVASMQPGGRGEEADSGPAGNVAGGGGSAYAAGAAGGGGLMSMASAPVGHGDVAASGGGVNSRASRGEAAAPQPPADAATPMQWEAQHPSASAQDHLECLQAAREAHEAFSADQEPLPLPRSALDGIRQELKAVTAEWLQKRMGQQAQQQQPPRNPEQPPPLEHAPGPQQGPGAPPAGEGQHAGAAAASDTPQGPEQQVSCMPADGPAAHPSDRPAASPPASQEPPAPAPASVPPPPLGTLTATGSGCMPRSMVFSSHGVHVQPSGPPAAALALPSSHMPGVHMHMPARGGVPPHHVPSLSAGAGGADASPVRARRAVSAADMAAAAPQHLPHGPGLPQHRHSIPAGPTEGSCFSAASAAAGLGAAPAPADWAAAGSAHWPQLGDASAAGLGAARQPFPSSSAAASAPPGGALAAQGAGGPGCGYAGPAGVAAPLLLAAAASAPVGPRPSASGRSAASASHGASAAQAGQHHALLHGPQLSAAAPGGGAAPHGSYRVGQHGSMAAEAEDDGEEVHGPAQRGSAGRLGAARHAGLAPPPPPPGLYGQPLAPGYYRAPVMGPPPYDYPPGYFYPPPYGAPAYGHYGPYRGSGVPPMHSPGYAGSSRPTAYHPASYGAPPPWGPEYGYPAGGPPVVSTGLPPRPARGGAAPGAAAAPVTRAAAPDNDGYGAVGSGPALGGAQGVL